MEPPNRSLNRWLPVLILIGAVFVLLAGAFHREAPPIVMLLCIGGLLLIGSAIIDASGWAIERLLVTDTGIKWDWVLLPVFLVVALRYGVPLLGRDFDDLYPYRFILWLMGCFALSCSWHMVRKERAKIIGEGLAKAEKGKPKLPEWFLAKAEKSEPMDYWHGDIARYQVPLVLYALGLTLVQMAAD